MRGRLGAGATCSASSPSLYSSASMSSAATWSSARAWNGAGDAACGAHSTAWGPGCKVQV